MNDKVTALNVDLTLFGTSGHSRPHLHVPSVRRYTLTSSTHRRTVPLGLKKKKKIDVEKSDSYIWSKTVLKFHLFFLCRHQYNQHKYKKKVPSFIAFIHDFVILLMLLKQNGICVCLLVLTLFASFEMLCTDSSVSRE